MRTVRIHPETIGVDFTSDMSCGFSPMGRQSRVSQLVWDNPDVMNALRFMFRATPNERIVGVEVNTDGIKAYFERVKR